MPYIHFTEEQKLRASEVDLELFLRSRGEDLIRSGPEYRLASDHSITVRGNSWYDHAAEQGGGPISFVQQFYNLSYPEAVTCLLGGEQGTVYAYLDFLLYKENSSGNPCVIISYELCRYKILNHLPLSENESIREIATFGAEQYPDYFGHYPVPTLTPWGCTTRHKTITNGLFWLETEQCQRGLAIASPRYDDLSDGARGLAEKFDDGFALPGQQDPGNIFFTEPNSSVPLFELLSGIPEEQIVCPINRVALMNAIYQYHPEYAAMYNSAEQAGLNDAFGLLMNILGIQTELHGDIDRVIRLFPQSGIDFIAF